MPLGVERTTAPVIICNRAALGVLYLLAWHNYEVIMDIDISGLDKAEVLAALYNRAGARDKGFVHFSPNPMTKEEAQEVIDNPDLKIGGYINGREVKVYFDAPGAPENTVRVHLYDRTYGEGTAQAVIDALRNKEAIPVHPDQTADMAQTAQDARNSGSDLNIKFAEAIERKGGENFLKKALGEDDPEDKKGKGDRPPPSPRRP